MPITERVARLRKQSLEARPSISAQRAELLTSFYQQNRNNGWSTPVERAEAFRYLMEHKTHLHQRGRTDRRRERRRTQGCTDLSRSCAATVCKTWTSYIHEKRPLRSRPTSTRKVYEETIIPFWQGKTMRERIFRGDDRGVERRLTKRAYSPSSWSSARPDTPCWTTRSTARACWTSSRTSETALEEPGLT